MLTRYKSIFLPILCLASYLLALPLQAAEEDEDKLLLFLNCVVAGEAADEFGEMFGLTPGGMEQGFLDFSANATYSDRELEAFRWRKRLPAGCPVNALPDERLPNYVVDQILAIANLTTGSPISIEDIAAVDAATPCAEVKALIDDGKVDFLKPRLAFIQKAIEMHHVLGEDVAPDGIHEQEIIWRAYWTGRWREKELSSDALQNYIDAFELFPEEAQRHEEIKLDTPLHLFDESEEFSEQRLEAFGPMSRSSLEGLDMPSYIARQQVWNYILSGETEFPVAPIDIHEARAWQPEILNLLEGEKPGEEQCAPLSYRTVETEIRRILRSSVRFVNEMREASIQASGKNASEYDSDYLG